MTVPGYSERYPITQYHRLPAHQGCKAENLNMAESCLKGILDIKTCLFSLLAIRTPRLISGGQLSMQSNLWQYFCMGYAILYVRLGFCFVELLQHLIIFFSVGINAFPHFSSSKAQPKTLFNFILFDQFNMTTLHKIIVFIVLKPGKQH